MNYQIIINGNQVLNGNIIGIILFTAIIITIIGIIIHYIYKKLTADSLLKYEFITIIAHKFRTPLTSIKWLIEGMVQEETDSYKKQSLDDIKASNQKLIDLTSTMIELTENASSGKASYVFEKLSLNSLVKVTADMLKNSFHEKNIFLNIQYSDHDIIIDADKARMEFVIQTILENACSYTSPGRNVNVVVFIEKGKASINFTDNGIGIKEEDLSKIFSKFYRTKDAKSTDTEGVGVGLFLAQSIMRHHGGKIVVYSEGLGKGSTFSLVMPRAK